MNRLSYKELEKELNILKNLDIKSSKDDQYRQLFDSMTEMVEVIEIIYNENNKAVDFYIRNVNISFAKLLGKTKEQLINKKISSVVSVIEENWFSYFANVDKTGITHTFKNYGVAFDKYYLVTAWKVSKNRVGVSFIDITETEKPEIELKIRLEKARNKTELILKEKKVELNSTIDKLDNINSELAIQNEEKDDRADELVIAKREKAARANELIIAKKEKVARANELAIAKKELAFQKEIEGYRSEMESLALELTLLIDTANAPIFGIDNKGLVNEWNQTSEKITGFTKEEVLGNDLVQTYITEDYRESVKKVLENALQGKETANYEFPLFAKDGDRVMVLLNSSTRRNAAGDITGVLGVGQDITEIDKLRTASEAIGKELRQFIETANAPIFGIDSQGLVNEWNETSEKITGFKKEDVLGRDLVQTYITEDYREVVKQVFDDALQGKETANFEFPLFTKEGERVMVLLNSSTRRNAAGDITGVLGVGQDITELVGYRNDLELKVDQRTLKLNEALKKEKELNELKSRFVSIASHEFRTPLSAINFAAGSMKKYWAKMDPLMVSNKLQKIESQVLHMTRLLDDVLIVGQSEAGEMRNHPLNLNLERFISEIIEEVHDSSDKSHDIVLIGLKALKSSNIYIDEKLGRNIFINLLSNAVKFSPNSDKVLVELSSDKNHIIISITDFGIGIPNSELKNIFMPFIRGENVDLIQGTGLGLSIVKEAVDLIGGKIIVSPTLGNGTSFIVKIPKNLNT